MIETPADVVKALADIEAIILAAISGQTVVALPAALDLVKQIAVALPPLDAKDLDPVDRAEADAEAQALEDAKFPVK